MVKSQESRRYVKVDANIRTQLIYRAVVLRHSIKQASRDLRVNYATAKVIVQKQRQAYEKMADQ